MTKNDIKINKVRLGFSKKIKRKIFLEIINGKKPKDAFFEYVFDVVGKKDVDEKYFSKLFYKWRKEIYQNKEMMDFLTLEINNDSLKDEIMYIGSDCEVNEIDREAIERFDIDLLEDVLLNISTIGAK